MELADKLYENGNYALAIREYIKIMETSDDYPSYVYYNIGLAYLRLNDRKMALNYFRIANDLFVNDIEITNLINELSEKDEKSQGGVKV